VAWTCSRSRLGKDMARGWGDETHDGPRVLFESPDGAEAHAAWALLRRHGYGTMWCSGPQGDAECSLVADGHCPLVDEADAVVSALDLDDPSCQAVAEQLENRAGETPVVVVAPRATAPRWVDELPACQVVTGPLSAKVLIRSLHVAGFQRRGS
jgi:hypothetical protein